MNYVDAYKELAKRFSLQGSTLFEEWFYDFVEVYSANDSKRVLKEFWRFHPSVKPYNSGLILGDWERLLNIEIYKKKEYPDKTFEYLKELKEKKRFDGNRLKVLERDLYSCQECGRSHHEVPLTVHHKDGNGRDKDNPNNKMSNLITLCRSCHTSLHKRKTK